MTSNEFMLPIRVYYEDTDAGGVVYHAQYLNFMERARTEWLRALGYEQKVLAQQGVVFVVGGLQIDYRKPARLDDALVVETRIENFGRASMGFEQRIWREPAGDEGTAKRELLTAALVKVVCVGTDNLRPTAIPTAIKGALSSDH